MMSDSIEQLQALGHTDRDRVYYRAIHPTKGARKIEGMGLIIPPQVHQASDDGFNLYLVVNGGGHVDADVTAGRAIFYEHDNLEKALQADLWRSLGLPEPTFQVDTGGKSIHSYWVFEEPIAIDLWRSLQADLLAYSDGDRSIKNPSRVMRLAGFKHQGTGQTSTIITNSGQRYTAEVLREVIPTPAKEPAPNRSIHSAINVQEVPLLSCLAPVTRNLIRDGAGEGGRNDTGAKVARDLIGTAAELGDMGVRVDGDPRGLFGDYCRNCSPAIDDREADQIWASAEKSNPGASLSPDKIKGCIAAWEKRQQRPARAKNQEAIVEVGEVLPPQSPFTESLYTVSDTGRVKLKPVSRLARLMSEEWANLRYNLETESFWEYGDGLWVSLNSLTVEKRIFEAIESTSVGFSPNTISGAFKMLSSLKSHEKWEESKTLIPMANGVFNPATKQLLPHSPEYGFRWRLPYAYSPLATCEPIEEWIAFTQECDPKRVQLLRAYLKAIVMGRTDLQRFLELVGPGGTGKSTFANLAIALVGIENCHVTELQRLERDRFETANLYGKRLIYLTDSERYAAGVSVFKSLTGGDPLPFEQKYKQAQGNFSPSAMVILCANEAIASSDHTSGMERRRLTVPFTQRVSPGERRNLLTVDRNGATGDFAEHLPGLFNWAMAIDDSEVRNLIVNTLISVPSLAACRGETLIASNSIAEWLDSECVFIEGFESSVGKADKRRIGEGNDGRWNYRDEFVGAGELLYPNYQQFCSESGLKAIGLNRFSELVVDLCRDQLGNPGVTKQRKRHGSVIVGIALRRSTKADYSDLPRPITGALDLIEDLEFESEFEFSYQEAA
jgi:P4 family phage/plasmid primase-like protien